MRIYAGMDTTFFNRLVCGTDLLYTNWEEQRRQTALRCSIVKTIAARGGMIEDL
jgi:hypothetical protein